MFSHHCVSRRVDSPQIPASSSSSSSSPSSTNSSSSSDSEADGPQQQQPKKKNRRLSIGEDNSAWTLDEDGAICKLRKDGESWRAIGKALNASGAAVESRWRHLDGIFATNGTSADAVAIEWARDMTTQGREIPSPEKPSPVKKGAGGDKRKMGEGAGRKGTSKGKGEKDKDKKKAEQPPKTPKNKTKWPQGDKPEKGKSKKKAPPKSSSDSSDSSSESQARRKENKKNDKNKKQQRPKPTEKGKPKNQKNDEKKAAPSPSYSSESSTDSEEERAEQKHYVYHHLYSEIYPNQRTDLRPDDFWTKEDCRILTIIEAKHNELKWHNMQAEFFNATGRMLPVALIKHKMGEAKEN